MNKKILFVITKSNWGGAQRYVYDLATHLPKGQFDVTVALGGADELKHKLEVAGVRVLPLQNAQRDISVSADTSAFFSLYRTIKSCRPDIVHLNSSKAGGLGALAARLLKVPNIVFTVHGWPFEEKRNIFWRLFAFVGSYTTALLSHTAIVISKKDLKIGKSLPFCGHKMHLIHNGIDFSMQFDSGEIIRRAFPLGAHITGTIGELTQNKNHISLIERARVEPNLNVAIVGEGEERTQLEAKIKEYKLSERVKLFGFIHAHKVMKGFDLFAFPSLKEGLPYVLLEAKVACLPIVANRVGGVGDVLDAQDMKEFTLDQMVQNTVALY